MSRYQQKQRAEFRNAKAPKPATVIRFSPNGERRGCQMPRVSKVQKEIMAAIADGRVYSLEEISAITGLKRENIRHCFARADKTVVPVRVTEAGVEHTGVARAVFNNWLFGRAA